MPAEVFVCPYESPVGPLTLVMEAGSLTGVFFAEHRHDPQLPTGVVWSTEPFLDVRLQLDGYFAGTRQEFDLPLKASGTDFQQRVWAELLQIPFGVITTYGELAARLGDRQASRAVGLANGKNPISIIVPCHRVLGADGSLTGYGGGLDRKLWLLRHEGALLA